MNLADQSQGGKAVVLYAVAAAFAGLPWVVPWSHILSPWLVPYFTILKPIWTALFILGMLLWKSFEQWDELNEKHKPRLEVSVPGPEDSVPENGLLNRAFLLQITNTSTLDVEECIVEMTKIESGSESWSFNAQLSFQPHEENQNAVPKTLRPGASCKTDVIYIRWRTSSLGYYAIPGTKIGGVAGFWNRTPAFYTMFPQDGTCLLYIQISAKAMYPPLKRILKFTANSNNFSFELMPPS